VFLDTPGVHRAESDLGRIMNRLARRSVEGVDAVLLVLDASSPPRIEDDGWMRRLAREPTVPVVAALNKTDIPGSDGQPYRALWDTIAAASASAVQPVWHPVSALDGTGANALLDHLLALMPNGPLLFPEDVLTDFPRKLAVADAIREKYFEVLQQELPHSIAVWVEEIVETPAGGWDVSATVYVGRHSQKGIVLGAKGRLLRRVTRSASRELSAIHDREVRVHLWVKVEKDWSRNFWLLKKFGYEG
jgi:GTP-binding protein Era